MSGEKCKFATKLLTISIYDMKRFLSFVYLAACITGIAVAQSGYPYTQVPFTAVKIAPNTFCSLSGIED